MQQTVCVSIQLKEKKKKREREKQMKKEPKTAGSEKIHRWLSSHQPLARQVSSGELPFVRARSVRVVLCLRLHQKWYKGKLNTLFYHTDRLIVSFIDTIISIFSPSPTWNEALNAHQSLKLMLARIYGRLLSNVHIISSFINSFYLIDFYLISSNFLLHNIRKDSLNYLSIWLKVKLRDF